MRGLVPGSTAALRQQVLARHHRKRAKGALNISTTAVYASVFALIIAAVVVGYREPQKSTSLANATTINNTGVDHTKQTSVDEVVATNIAAGVAQTTNLSIAPAITNLAMSTLVKSELAQSNDANISKPQILQPTADNREIINYAVVSGDTVDGLSIKFGILKETIKWANNLTSDAIEAGKVLQILPVDGVIYTVKSGDTLQSIAQKYNVNQARIVLYNDLDEATNLVVGSKIILPEGSLPTQERPGYIAPRQYANSYSGYTYGGYAYGGYEGTVKYLRTDYGPTTPGNTSYAGQCTWYVWERRLELGLRMPAGAILGNAAEWSATLGRRGYSVVYGVPSVGAIMQSYNNHVAIVESIAENGDVTVTEMNYGYRTYVVTGRVISAGQARSGYNYIQ